MAETIIANLSSLNPFGKGVKYRKTLDSDDVGESLGPDAIAGGGHSARTTHITKSQLRISDALKTFLVSHNVITEAEADQQYADRSSSLQGLLDLPHINVPKELTDRRHPLPAYYISSSHNTYLEAHQLVGSSSATAYRTALTTGSRCVEIDAWDNDADAEEPKVTHGYTLVSRVSFRSVCEVIRDVYDNEAQEAVDEQGYRAAPILISLENHCGADGQLRLVQIMHEVFGKRLLSKAVREGGHEEQAGGQHVTLAELGSKICIVVEHHLPNEAEDSDSSSDSSSDDEQKEEYKKEAKKAPSTIIIPELAELGVYAQSVKPSNNSWFEELSLGPNGPHHHLINVSETGLARHFPQHNAKIAHHNAHHLMRVFPKGTRISSRNLNPVPFWAVGAQVAALNWQVFGATMQINEALFSGSDGYILKPAALREGGSGSLSTGRTKKLRLHVAGATKVPLTDEDKSAEIRPYVTCSLSSPLLPTPLKKKTSPYKPHKLTSLLSSKEISPPTQPLWDEVLEWEYEDNELVFLRLLVKSDDSFKTNPILAVTAVRIEYVIKGVWRFIRLLDLHGRETTCSILVKFEVEDA